MPKAWGMGDLAISLCTSLSGLPSPSISIKASHARGKSMMVCGNLFSSQICLKVAAMPSAFPIPATTHWRTGGLPPARPALWTGTAPPRYRVPDSPAPIHCPPIQSSPLPRKELYTPPPQYLEGPYGTNYHYIKHSPVVHRTCTCSGEACNREPAGYMEPTSTM